MLSATSRPPESFQKGMKRCVRCGLERSARPRAVLCTDCRDALTKTEAKAWYAA